eukprot:scaffold78481_cov16-Tisochrysis_lutea.AAC.1
MVATLLLRHVPNFLNRSQEDERLALHEGLSWEGLWKRAVKQAPCLYCMSTWGLNQKSTESVMVLLRNQGHKDSTWALQKPAADHTVLLRVG